MLAVGGGALYISYARALETGPVDAARQHKAVNGEASGFEMPSPAWLTKIKVASLFSFRNKA